MRVAREKRTIEPRSEHSPRRRASQGVRQMASPTAWLFEFEIKPDHAAAFERLVSEMVESTRAERGALNFEWYIDPDGRTGQVYERYADEAATLVHLRSFGDRFAAR